MIAADDGADRWLQLLATLANEAPDSAGLCAAAQRWSPGIDGSSLVLIGAAPARSTVSSAGQLSDKVEDLQYALGEGPCFDSFASGQPVLAGDLLDPEYQLRWPAFTSGALAIGVSAVFAFPLQVGAIRIGVLNVHRMSPGPLSTAQLADSLMFADAATLRLLDEGTAGDGNNLRLDHRAVVHQATGMVMAQLNVTAAEALARLRGHSYAQGVPVDTMAKAVVSRRVRFDGLEE